MSGAGVGETPNAAFAALSARGSSLGIAGLSSGITELEHFLKTGDDKAFTEGQDRRCRALNGLGLSKADKVTLAAVSMFQTGDDLDDQRGRYEISALGGLWRSGSLAASTAGSVLLSRG